jgi:hypothetical protein
LLLFCAFLFNYFFWIHATNLTTQSSIAQGMYPQNLMEQFYRAQQDASLTMQKWHNRINKESPWFVGAFRQWLTFRHYWGLAGGDPEKVTPPRGSSQKLRKKAIPVEILLKIWQDVLLIASTEKEAWCLIEGLDKQKFDLQFLEGQGMYKIFAIRAKK